MDQVLFYSVKLKRSSFSCVLFAGKGCYLIERFWLPINSAIVAKFVRFPIVLFVRIDSLIIKGLHYE